MPLEDAVGDPELLALSREKLPDGRYAWASPADLWYCACGGVNRGTEQTCHRCGKARSLVAQYADAAQLAALRQARLDEEARQEAERERARQEAEARRAAVKERAAQWKERVPPFREKETPEAGGKSGKKALAAAGAGLAVVAVAAVVLLLPGLSDSKGGAVDGGPVNITVPGSGEETGDPAQTQDAAAPGDTAAPDGGVPDGAAPDDVVALYVHEDEEGHCFVNPDLVREYFPDCSTSCFAGVPDLGSDIDAYLMDSFSFADLMETGLGTGISGEGETFDPHNDPDSTYALLVFQVFSGTPHLVGYFVGVPEAYGDGVWRLDITPCDYDLTRLYQEQSAAFAAEKESLSQRYIAPENVAASGAKYFLKGYNTGRSPDPGEDDCQMYHLWSELNSPYVARFSRDIGRFDTVRANPGRWRCCLLLDGDYKLMGYTMISGG